MQEATEYEYYGDCIGLSQEVYGTPGPYVMSDSQFALNMVKDWRLFNYLYHIDEGDDYSIGDIDYRASIALGTRFFIKEEFKGD